MGFAAALSSAAIWLRSPLPDLLSDYLNIHFYYIRLRRIHKRSFWRCMQYPLPAKENRALWGVSLKIVGRGSAVLTECHS
jgi:hypothetical protein